MKVPPRIAIIGGGATGVIAACQLIDKFEDRIEIDIFEPNELLGAGLAYKAQDSELILNVPIARMNYAPEKLKDFEEFLKSHYFEAFSSKKFPYVSRSYYLAYLQKCLAGKLLHARFIHRRERVCSIRAGTDALVLVSNEASRVYEYVFVASGYKTEMSFCEGGRSQILSCFDELAIKAIPERSRVLIVGMGLSAIDILQLLRGKNDIQITTISRRGLWPISHQKVPSFLEESWQGYTPLQIFRRARQLHEEGKEWADIADSFRGEITARWKAWSDREKNTFATHIRPFWELIRHRLPPSVEIDLQRDLEAGRVQSLRGALRDIEVLDGTVRSHICFHGQVCSEVRNFDFAIVAMGAKVNDEFLSFSGHNRIHFLGPASKSLHWEITAIPEITRQVAYKVDALNTELSGDSALR